MAAYERTRLHENYRMSEEGRAMLEQLKAMYGPEVAARLWSMGPSRGTRSGKYFMEVVMAFAEEDILRFVQAHHGLQGGQHGGSMEDLRNALTRLKERFMGGSGKVGDLITKGTAQAIDAATLGNFVKVAAAAATGSSIVYGPQLMSQFSTSWSSLFQLMISYAPEALTLLCNAGQTVLYSAGLAGLGMVGVGAVGAFLGALIMTQKTIGAIHKGALKGTLGVMNSIHNLNKMSIEDILLGALESMGGKESAAKIREALSKCTKGSLKEGVPCSTTPVTDAVESMQEQVKEEAAAVAANIGKKPVGITVYEVGTSRILFKLYGPNAKLFAEKMLASANVSLSPGEPRRTRRGRGSRSRSRSRSPISTRSRSRNATRNRGYGNGYRRVTRSSSRSVASSPVPLTRSKLASIRENH